MNQQPRSLLKGCHSLWADHGSLDFLSCDGVPVEDRDIGPVVTTAILHQHFSHQCMYLK